MYIQSTYVSLAKAEAEVISPVTMILSNRMSLPTVHSSNPRAEMGVN